MAKRGMTQELIERLLRIRGTQFTPLENDLVTEAADALQSQSARIAELLEALKPFADCVDQIADDEDDEEWAKFRLLIKDYRKAAQALKRPHFERCPTCGGEFDQGEWNASNECPECETPKQVSLTKDSTSG